VKWCWSGSSRNVCLSWEPCAGVRHPALNPDEPEEQAMRRSFVRTVDVDECLHGMRQHRQHAGLIPTVDGRPGRRVGNQDLDQSVVDPVPRQAGGFHDHLADRVLR
jgi:hypothetical protein